MRFITSVISALLISRKCFWKKDCQTDASEVPTGIARVAAEAAVPLRKFLRVKGLHLFLLHLFLLISVSTILIVFSVSSDNAGFFIEYFSKDFWEFPHRKVFYILFPEDYPAVAKVLSV